MLARLKPGSPAWTSSIHWSGPSALASSDNPLPKKNIYLKIFIFRIKIDIKFCPLIHSSFDFFFFFFRSYDRKIAMDLCADNIQCQYDYALTLNRDLAYFTKKYYSSLVNIREINQRRGKRSISNIPKFIKNYFYLLNFFFFRICFYSSWKLIDSYHCLQLYSNCKI